MFFRRSLLRQSSNLGLETHVAFDGSSFIFNRCLMHSYWACEEPKVSALCESTFDSSDLKAQINPESSSGNNAVDYKPQWILSRNHTLDLSKSFSAPCETAELPSVSTTTGTPSASVTASSFKFDCAEFTAELDSSATREIAAQFRHHLRSNPGGSIVKSALQSIDHFVACLNASKSDPSVAELFDSATAQLAQTWKFFTAKKRSLKPESLIAWISVLAEARAIQKKLGKPKQVSIAIARAAAEWQSLRSTHGGNDGAEFLNLAEEALNLWMVVDVSGSTPSSVLHSGIATPSSDHLSVSNPISRQGSVGIESNTVHIEIAKTLDTIDATVTALRGELSSLRNAIPHLKSQVSVPAKSPAAESLIAGDGSVFVYNQDTKSSAWQIPSDDWQPIRTPDGVSFFYSRSREMSVWKLP